MFVKQIAFMFLSNLFVVCLLLLFAFVFVFFTFSGTKQFQRLNKMVYKKDRSMPTLTFYTTDIGRSQSALFHEIQDGERKCSLCLGNRIRKTRIRWIQASSEKQNQEDKKLFYLSIIM